MKTLNLVCKVLAEDTINVNYAFLTLTEEKCRQLLGLRKHVIELEKAISGFYCIELSNVMVRFGCVRDDADYYEDGATDLMQRRLSRISDAGEWVNLLFDPLAKDSDLLDADGGLPHEEEISCINLRVKADGVLWTAQDSDNSFKTLETETIFWKQLESAIKKGGKLLFTTIN